MKCRNSIKQFLLTSFLLSSQAALADTPLADEDELARGKYIVQIGGCHDCHTPGYPENAGQVPAENWLTGNTVGFQGPWGTSYPVNLRLYVQTITEAQWIARVRKPMLPPMPWFNLRDMTDADLVAVYRFIDSLGPAGTQAPVAAQPGVKVSTPYFEFVPRNLSAQAAAH